MILLFPLFSCSEYAIDVKPPPEEVEPVGLPDDPEGDAPNWDDCDQAYDGSYYNLTVNHMDVEPEEDLPPQFPTMVDWWDEEYLAFHRTDPSLDFGPNWWPVNEGFDQDPSYFGAHWFAWMRVHEEGQVDVIVASSDDFYMAVNNEIVLSIPGIQEFESQRRTLTLPAGQFPIEIWYAHRSGESGLRFREVSDNAVICAPE